MSGFKTKEESDVETTALLRTSDIHQTTSNPMIPLPQSQPQQLQQPPQLTTTSRPLLDSSTFPSTPADTAGLAAREIISGSSTAADSAMDDVATNVSTMEQLEDLPMECLSGDPVRPLQHFDEDGNVFTYALQPMMYSVFTILLMEGIERFAFYGINYTQTSYLTGAYKENWNAGMDAILASSYVSVSVAVAYTTPFLGAFLADHVLGDYQSILAGTVFFYIPGMLLIALTTVPGLLGEEFNRSALGFGLLVLWPTGTGIVKSVVNVFGAKQFHPLLQSSLIESYYVKFYMCINIGALIGGVIVPLLAQENVTVAYFLPLVLLSLGTILFASKSSRYVRRKPAVVGGGGWRSLLLLIGLGTKKPSPARAYAINNTGDPIKLSAIFRISLLVVPFSIVYSQMSTTFIVQGTVMKKAFGFVDAACMNNADAIAVLVFGHFIGSVMYPWMATRGIKIPTTYKFAIGSALGAASIAWALLVEHMIVTTYATTGGRVNIMWQAMSYVLIGAGEIFAVSAAYEVAFKASPPEEKVLFSAMNLFCIGGLPSVFCIGLYQACIPWFRNSDGNTSISHIHEYATANIRKYFWLLFFISIVGTLVNLIPAVREYVMAIEERATDMIRTPKTPMRPPRREPVADEESALLKARRHQYYLKYGSGPSLYKHGSMRAGPSLSQRKIGQNLAPERPHLKRSTLSKLYQTENYTSGVSTIMIGGKPVTMANTISSGPEAFILPPRTVSDGVERSNST